MSPSSSQTAGGRKGLFVVAAPARWDGDNNAVALTHHGLLRFMALGTRRGVAGVPAELTRLNPKIGLAAYIAARTLSTFQGESFRFRLHPWFDRWVKSQLREGDHIISSHGFTNDCFKFVHRHGGRTFLSAGNSHPENFWKIIAEEHRRWGWRGPPISHFQHKRAMEMLPDVDYVLSPSAYVTNSFLERGFRREQILRNIYPTDLSRFKPADGPRDPKRPLTVISTGSISLRKGAPYMMEAFRQIHQRHPSTRFLLTRAIHDSALGVVEKYRDLPIEWAPALPHPELARRLQGADVFVLPSLEEGLVRTALEAMACGLPVVVTPNTGISDFMVEDVTGEVVPIRDPEAIANAVLKWGDRVMNSKEPPARRLDPALISFETFEKEFIGQLEALKLA